MLSQLEQFLRGTKTSEKVAGLALRDAISVSTGLEGPVADALSEGYHVVITGSAGGGKTHLVHAVMQALLRRETSIRSRLWNEPGGAADVRVVPDLTATAPSDRDAALSATDALAVLVAANEGTLSSLAAPPFDRVLPALHAMQQGQVLDVPTQPVVVDLAGFNPFHGAFEQILGMSLLADLVEQLDCCAEKSSCPRAAAWRQLQAPAVRLRLNDLLAASQGPSEVLFRELWDYVGDVALGGDCQASPPTSVWFWRVFYGDSTLASRLRDAVAPDAIAIPQTEVRLFYGDWLNLGTDLEAEPVWPARPPADAADPEEGVGSLRWLRVQVALLSRDELTSASLKGSGDMVAAIAIVEGNVADVIARLNRYHRYNLSAQVPEAFLELWMDLSVERRQLRPIGAFSLGTVNRPMLRIARSRLIGNWPHESYGSRAYLVGPGDAALRLDETLLRALSRGRSMRSADRQNDDIEWAIWRFYMALAGGLRIPDVTRLDTLHFGDDFDEASVHSWLIEHEQFRLEPAQ